MTSRRLRVHPEVIDDLRDALTYYRDQGDPAAADRLVEVFVRGLNRIEQSPLTGREYLAGFRRIVLVPFPYLLTYSVDDTTVYIAAILHAKRDPAHLTGVLRERR